MAEGKDFPRGAVPEQEDALEKVTGGAGAPSDFYASFSRNNCKSCAKHYISCPYNDDPAKIYDALQGFNTCRERVAATGFNRPK